MNTSNMSLRYKSSFYMLQSVSYNMYNTDKYTSIKIQSLNSLPLLYGIENNPFILCYVYIGETRDWAQRQRQPQRVLVLMGYLVNLN